MHRVVWGIDSGRLQPRTAAAATTCASSSYIPVMARIASLYHAARLGLCNGCYLSDTYFANFPGRMKACAGNVSMAAIEPRYCSWGYWWPRLQRSLWRVQNSSESSYVLRSLRLGGCRGWVRMMRVISRPRRSRASLGRCASDRSGQRSRRALQSGRCEAFCCYDPDESSVVFTSSLTPSHASR